MNKLKKERVKNESKEDCISIDAYRNVRGCSSLELLRKGCM